MKRTTWLVLVAIGLQVAMTGAHAESSSSASAMRTGAFVGSEAFILGTFWTKDHAFHVAVYRDQQIDGTDATRAVVERERSSDGVVDAADDETLAADALRIGPHPTRPGLHQLTFNADLPHTGSWDLTFSGRLRETHYTCLHGVFSTDSSAASTNLPSRTSTINGATVEIQSQCFQWGGPGDGTYSTPWAAGRPPLAFGF